MIQRERQLLRGMPPEQGLYSPTNEHDSCGVGFVVNLDGKPSFGIVESGIEVLKNLLHRGASGADMNTGDGAGLLLQLPDRFLRRECALRDIELGASDTYGVGMLFLPQDSKLVQTCQNLVEEVAAKEGLGCLGWRDVPTEGSALGEDARREQPSVKQCFLESLILSGDALERKLFVIRKQAEKLVKEVIGNEEIFYIASLSCRTIVYKGLMMATQVPEFYPDLKDVLMESAIAVVHQRYSTNTFPSWSLAQPFRYLAHNGEINTLRGNLNWMRSREQRMSSRAFGKDLKKILPIVEESGSDSACLDNALELLRTGGRSLAHSVAMLVPQAWGDKYPMGPDLRGFFEYHAGLMEPWDGPAALAFTDGSHVGALLDRNGLRPARYTLTKKGFMVLASETGVLDIPSKDIRELGALRPGQMIVADLKARRLMKDGEIKTKLARHQPYRRWVEENKIAVHGFYNAVSSVTPEKETLIPRQKLFGYTREDRRIILNRMASTGHEPTGSMGADQPLAVLSEKPQLLYWYFKQIFAQITNPAIDSIREELVMTLMTFLGISDNILTETPQHGRLVKLRHPILSNDDLHRIQTLNLVDFQCERIIMGFPAGDDLEALEKAVDELCKEAERAVRGGARMLILSDRDLPAGQAPIPALLAVSAVNQKLIRETIRTPVGIIVETGEAREVMHVALLLGYGASAVNPYLAFEIISQMALENELNTKIGVAKAIENYINALCTGLLKIMSKIGISTLRSYRSAQVFEAIGLSEDVVEKYFEGTASRIQGIGMEDIAKEVLSRYAASIDAQNHPEQLLPSGGQYQFRKDGERHLWNPDTISYLQKAARNNDYETYRKFAASINDQEDNQSTLRGLFRFKKTESIPLEEVEPASEIVKRFVTGAMSFGSISREAHETLAVAMNRLGGMSNSGEGGEDPERYVPLPNGDSRSSAIKQIASGRFGVTAEYLINAKDLQIKIAQGAKPGEGGQLPGHKVNAEIARVRHSTPGVTLISPPPHHDIYSIEDIAQLIYDLRNANQEARVSVKLVSEVGVGTIAAGVAKARADMILISGYDGGTGAAPLSSVKHVGMPWELGLAETQQTLVLNGLRSRVRLQVDGQMKTGRDIVVGAMLGAEEFGFATAPLIVCGCVMMRKCHENTCPVGVATQDPRLRRRFKGKVEHVVNYFTMVAEEAREIMASLGIRKMDDLIGRSDLLETNHAIQFWKARNLDFSRIFHRIEAPREEQRKTIDQERGLDQALDWEILPQLSEAIENREKCVVEMAIRNVHRTVGAIISSGVVRRHGGAGLPDDTITLRFSGAAGQSFGAFCTKGMTLILEGAANDYLGKGLSGAKIILKPYAGSDYDPSTNVVAGNVLLYGATSGEVYIRGGAGERFAIRNSGALAVVEGVGDHGCEYMTGGRVVILGPTGVNFGAGMSGGIAYVYDETGMFDANCNLTMLDLELIIDPAEEQELKTMIEKHFEYTGSEKAKRILDNWEVSLPHFVKVFPMEYKRVLGHMSLEDEATERAEVLNA